MAEHIDPTTENTGAADAAPVATDVVDDGGAEEAASAASSPEIRRATSETWPFGTARGPVEGFLRSLDPNRSEHIQDFGESRLYPPFAPGGPPRLVQRDHKTKQLRCSGDGCENALEGCMHCWEDRFRFRDLKGGDWVVPIALTRHYTKRGGKYEGVKRHLPRRRS